MLEKFLNKKVQVRYTFYSSGFFAIKGIVTKIDENFIEVDNDMIIAKKYIVDIKSL